MTKWRTEHIQQSVNLFLSSAGCVLLQLVLHFVEQNFFLKGKSAIS
jgi:hypothetical protein